MRNKLREYAGKKPVLTSIIIVSCWILFSFIFRILNKTTALDQTPAGRLFLTLLQYYGLPLLAVYVFDYFWIYKTGYFFKTIKVGTYTLLTALLTIVFSVAAAADLQPKESFGIFIGILQAFGIGFFEETVFRGLIANFIGYKFNKDTIGVWKAVFISGGIFGLAHLNNIFAGVGVLQAGVQSLVAIFIGALLCAVYYRGRSLWAMMVLHALTDLGPLFIATFFDAGTTNIDVINSFSLRSLSPIIPNLLALIVVLRKSKINEVIENYNDTASTEL